MGIYFTTYHYLTQTFNSDSNKPSIISTLLSGGTAGLFTWIGTYPIDFVKTLIQCDDI